MAAETHIYDGSVRREVLEWSIYDGAQWRTIEEAWIYDGSAWRQIFLSGDGTVTVTNQSISHSAATAIAGIYFQTDGTVDKREGAVYTQVSTATDWIIPNGVGGNDYEIRFSALSYSGSFSGFSAVWTPSFGVWQGLGSQAFFKLQKTASGTLVATFTVEIRNADTEVVLDSATITLTVTVP